MQATTPTLVAGLYENVTEAVQPLLDNVAGNLKGLGCPQLAGVNEDMYGVYPGWGKAKGY